MKTVQIIKPIPLSPEQGGDTDGWKRTGAVVLPDEAADEFERLGWVDVISHDGERVVWGACCQDGAHQHYNGAEEAA